MYLNNEYKIPHPHMISRIFHQDAVSWKKMCIRDSYQAAMLEPHTAAELNIDDIKAMCDELIEAHGDYMSMYKWKDKVWQ